MPAAYSESDEYPLGLRDVKCTDRLCFLLACLVYSFPIYMGKPEVGLSWQSVCILHLLACFCFFYTCPLCTCTAKGCLDLVCLDNSSAVTLFLPGSILLWLSLCFLWCRLCVNSVLHVVALNRSGRWENEHILCQGISGLGASSPCSFYHQQDMITHSMVLLRLIRMAVER